jgi:transposase
VEVKPMTFANTKDGWSVWFDKLTRLDAAPNQIVIGIEATSRYHEDLYHELEQRGYVLCVLHPGQTHQFHRQQGRLTKTDRLDAMTIAKVLLAWGSAGRLCAKRAHSELSRIGPFAHPTLR